MEFKAFLLILLCFQLSNCKSLLDEPCGDWTPYKDEKCLKIFQEYFVSYADAENVCKNEDEALLPSITTQEKQQYMENLLNSQNVVDNVWIGLKRVDETFVWADGTPADYTHWAVGSPSNDSANCVEMETENGVFGYWADLSCMKKNLVICEKIQQWSLSKIQSTLINLVQNPVPIGFIYVQLPKEKPPQEVWSGLEWQDVTSDYAGLFFRAEGENSASFGEIQNESSPRLARVKSKKTYDIETNIPTGISVPAGGQESDELFISYFDNGVFTEKWSLTFQLSQPEVCPRNTAIRIWKRTL